MIKAFVAGWPVSHSMSPVLHGFWLLRHGIDGSYDAVAVPPAQFGRFLRDLPASGLAGGNVTLPHKEAAFALCDHADGEARAIGAVNTVWLEGGKICGSCTDAQGFAANLDDHAPDWRDADEVLVLGAGGAARAVVHAIVANGAGKVIIANRTVARAEAFSESFGPRVEALDLDAAAKALPRCRLVVNTTSLGMAGDGQSPLDLSGARPDTIVSDIVYVPLETPLLAQARNLGLKTVDGLGMLLHQAVPGFERWFGVRPSVDAQLRAHVLAELARRAANG